MAKKRKTKRDKIRSDLRQEFKIATPKAAPTIAAASTLTQESPSYTYMLDQVPLSNIKTTPLTASFTHIRKDLYKTGIITTSLVFAQLALFFALNQ